jgi:hypothetical protein
LFSRSRISLPVLKNGTDFWSTETCAPVRGLRPGAGRAMLDRERPETAQLDAVAARERRRDLAENRVDDVFDVALVEMRVLSGNALNELRFDHGPRRLPVVVSYLRDVHDAPSSHPREKVPLNWPWEGAKGPTDRQD